MMNVLVTGHKGYIGQHLCKMIKQSRPEINLFGLDKCGTAEDRQDICQRFYSDMEYNTVIHLAARVRVGESVNKPTLYYDTNINGTLNILDCVKYHNFIFASTGAASNPSSPYGYSKRVAEDIVAEKCYDYTIFRFYNVTGTDGFPATNPDGLFYNLAEATRTGEFNLYGTDYNTKDGTCVREYVHVNDICESLIKAIDTPANSIENLAYGDTRTTREIIDTFKEVNNVDFKVNELPRRAGDLEACHLDKPSNYMVQRYNYEEMLKIY